MVETKTEKSSEITEDVQKLLELRVFHGYVISCSLKNNLEIKKLLRSLPNVDVLFETSSPKYLKITEAESR